MMVCIACLVVSLLCYEVQEHPSQPVWQQTSRHASIPRRGSVQQALERSRPDLPPTAVSLAP
eukprot:scaffold127863_cov13-Prasinocladus_malaysianus.AAC.1